MEDTLREELSDISTIGIVVVLILVLMEDTLREICPELRIFYGES